MNAPKILDGKSVAAAVLDECRVETAALLAKGIRPGLAVVLVGSDPASQVYVGSKSRTCTELGFHSVKVELPAETTQEELLQVVRGLNADPAVHGILVQSPPPKHIDEEAIIRAIDPRKDVDGFHPENVAKLVLEDPSGFVPCTPAGCMKLLEISGITTNGAEAVVIGRSMIVGKPMALLLVSKNSNATVTIAHSRSKDLPAICRRADILIAAVGRPEMVKALGETRSCRHRRRHQSRPRRHQKIRLPPHRRCRVSGSRPALRRHHPGPRRRRPDDHRDADEKHVAGGAAAIVVTDFGPSLLPATRPHDPKPAIQQAVFMSATFQIPDELYREVKAETAREGRTLRDVTISLFEQWLRDRKRTVTPSLSVDWRDFKAPLAHLVSENVSDHSMEAMRENIVKHWNDPT